MIVIKRTLKIANRIKKRFRAKIHETFLSSKQTSPRQYLFDSISLTVSLRQHLPKIFLSLSFDYG